MNVMNEIGSFQPALLVEQVAEVLVNAILDGTLKGGEKLAEPRLQKQFGISRTPLREALRELEKNGFVEIIPRRGAFVKQISPKSVDDNFPVRAVLEGVAAKQALENFEPEEIEALEATLESMERAAEKDDAMEYLRCHVQFHTVYLNGSRNDVLIDILSKLHIHNIWHRYYFKYHREDYKSSLAVHRQILDMFKHKKNSPEEVEHFVKGHIMAGYRRFLEYIRDNA